MKCLFCFLVFHFHFQVAIRRDFQSDIKMFCNKYQFRSKSGKREIVFMFGFFLLDLMAICWCSVLVVLMVLGAVRVRYNSMMIMMMMKKDYSNNELMSTLVARNNIQSWSMAMPMPMRDDSFPLSFQVLWLLNDEMKELSKVIAHRLPIKIDQ